MTKVDKYTDDLLVIYYLHQGSRSVCPTFSQKTQNNLETGF